MTLTPELLVAELESVRAENDALKLRVKVLEKALAESRSREAAPRPYPCPFCGSLQCEGH